MNKKQKKIVGQIHQIACDKRSHVMLQDCIDWYAEKMRYIKILAKNLPMIKAEVDKSGAFKENLCKIKPRAYRDKEEGGMIA